MPARSPCECQKVNTNGTQRGPAVWMQWSALLLNRITIPGMRRHSGYCYFVALQFLGNCQHRMQEDQVNEQPLKGIVPCKANMLVIIFDLRTIPTDQLVGIVFGVWRNWKFKCFLTEIVRMSFIQDGLHGVQGEFLGAWFAGVR